MKKIIWLAWTLNILSGTWLIYPHKTMLLMQHEIAIVTFSETLMIAFVLTALNQETNR